MKAINFILFLSFGLLSFPVISDAQQPFLLSSENIHSQNDNYIVVDLITSDSNSVRIVSQNLISMLSSVGYFHASVDSIVAIEEMKANVYFTKGARSTFSVIKDESDQDVCEYLFGEFYSLTDLNLCINSVIKSYSNNGYPFTTVSITNMEHISDSSLLIYLRVDPGKYVTLFSSKFTGNKSLDEQILSEIIGSGDPQRFHPHIIDDALSKLNRSEYISDAIYSGLTNIDSSYSAVYSINEIRSSTVDLLLGLEPKINSGYRLIGQGILQLNHLFVPASSLNIEFNRSGASESKLGLLYDQYTISQLPIGYGIGVELRQIDSTYLSIASMISTKWRIDSVKSLHFGFNYNKVTGSDDQQILDQLNQNRFEFSVEFKFSSINNWRVPTDGSTFKSKLSTGYVNIVDDDFDSGLPRGYSVNQFEMVYSRYFPVSQRFILVPSQHILHTIQNVYYDIDRNRFGGTHSMRGFREDQFRLAGYSMSTLEGRWMISTSSYLFTFASGAYTWTPNELGTRNYEFNFETIYSGGFGISYRVRPGILNVSYAISSDDSWLNGKVHFGITNSF